MYRRTGFGIYWKKECGNERGYNGKRNPESKQIGK